MNSVQVVARAGISYRQLDYWTRAGLIPGVSRTVVGVGSGHSRDWTWREAQFLEALGRLVKAGVQVRVASTALQQAGNLSDAETVTLPGGLRITLRPHLVAVADTAGVTS